MPKIGRDEILKARTIYDDYKRGKAALDERIVENDQWYRQQHWKQKRNVNGDTRRQTAWLMATIVNKHADFMDNMPECNVLPRERSDEQTAQMLTEILPVVLKRAHWHEAYSRCVDDKLQFGSGNYSVLWDAYAEKGLGEIRINSVDALNMAWEPGIEDIQDSANLFLTETIDKDVLVETYPEIKDLKKKLNGPAESATQYVRADPVDMTDKCTVINWYYKRKGVLHYCRFVQDIVLYASENDEAYRERGWYTDGRYPFVMDAMFTEPNTPHGFGLIDIGRDTQEDIDELNDLQMKNAKSAAMRRWFVRRDANINENEFADFNQPFVHYDGDLSEWSIREIPTEQYSATYVQIQQNKIEELKENTFNRDVNSGGSGQTSTAAGIAALQEAGSKSSRDAIQNTYRAFETIVEMVIERIRQFYDVPRWFRIVGEDKQARFETFSNERLLGQPVNGIEMDFGSKEPVFDLDIKVSKANAWSRQAQNQDVLNFYGMGFFNPQMATSALACLEVLDIDNKDKLTETIKKNGLKEQFAAQYLPALLQLAAGMDPELYMAAMQAAMEAGLIEQQAQPALPEGGAARAAETDINGSVKQANNYMDKQRQIAASRTTPQV